MRLRKVKMASRILWNGEHRQDLHCVVRRRLYYLMGGRRVAEWSVSKLPGWNEGQPLRWLEAGSLGCQQDLGL